MADNPFADALREYKAKQPADEDNPFAAANAARQSTPEKPTTDAGTAAARGFTGAASFGFRDEGSGLIAAGGGDPDNPDIGHALSSLAVGAYRKLTGDPEAEKRYAAEVARQREQGKVLEKEHPIASTVGQIGRGRAANRLAARGVAAEPRRDWPPRPAPRRAPGAVPQAPHRAGARPRAR